MNEWIGPWLPFSFSSVTSKCLFLSIAPCPLLSSPEEKAKAVGSREIGGRRKLRVSIYRCQGGDDREIIKFQMRKCKWYALGWIDRKDSTWQQGLATYDQPKKTSELMSLNPILNYLPPKCNNIFSIPILLEDKPEIYFLLRLTWFPAVSIVTNS